MCSHYQGIKGRERFFRMFHVYPPDEAGVYDVWPGYLASALRRPAAWDSGDGAVPALEAFNGRFGLLPHWTADPKSVRNTFNARSETVMTKPSFRDAWKRSQRCIIPADAIFEPDWRSGRAIATRVCAADDQPLAIAGIWACWKPPTGNPVLSFTMLTIPAPEQHLMHNFHKPDEEKRMVVILPQGTYADWLNAPLEKCGQFLQAYPSDRLHCSSEKDATPGLL
jgi:putative SOS response-associated peptidase YedK